MLSLIQLSSVLRHTLRLSVVWATIVTLTSSVVWKVDVKWRETGLMLLPCLISVRRPWNYSWKVLPDCLT